MCLEIGIRRGRYLSFKSSFFKGNYLVKRFVSGMAEDFQGSLKKQEVQRWSSPHLLFVG
jgi:hypothetical protein